jgi:hypothetical protein
MDMDYETARNQASDEIRYITFDWEKAATIIRDRRARNATAGLQGDWDATNVVIYRNGDIVRHPSVRLTTQSYVPILVLDDNTERPCWRVGEDFGEQWPDGALSILETH